MSLHDGFLFSQSNLQDYVDCQRRFQLHHILHQAWPAVEAEPYLENEQLMDKGARFHKIIRQHLTGVAEELISSSLGADEQLHQWWSNYLQSRQGGSLQMIMGQDRQHFEEITLSVPIDKFRLIAKYDLLTVQPGGKLLIIDWKTSQNRPKRSWLANRLQSHVYPFVLAGAAGAILGGTPPDPAQIEMIYWFANDPEQPERFGYNPANYAEDGRTISSLIADIDGKTDAIFPLTPQIKRCLFCTYRSLCNRGVKAGDLEHLEEWMEAESAEEVRLDIDQIGEIEL